jgi:hypothetical protein
LGAEDLRPRVHEPELGVGRDLGEAAEPARGHAAHAERAAQEVERAEAPAGDVVVVRRVAEGEVADEAHREDERPAEVEVLSQRRVEREAPHARRRRERHRHSHGGHVERALFGHDLVVAGVVDDAELRDDGRVLVHADERRDAARGVSDGVAFELAARVGLGVRVADLEARDDLPRAVELALGVDAHAEIACRVLVEVPARELARHRIDGERRHVADAEIRTVDGAVVGDARHDAPLGAHEVREVEAEARGLLHDLAVPHAEREEPGAEPLVRVVPGRHVAHGAREAEHEADVARAAEHREHRGVRGLFFGVVVARAVVERALVLVRVRRVPLLLALGIPHAARGLLRLGRRRGRLCGRGALRDGLGRGVRGLRRGRGRGRRGGRCGLGVALGRR